MTLSLSWLRPPLNTVTCTESDQAWVRILGSCTYLALLLALFAASGATLARDGLLASLLYALFAYLWGWVVATKALSPLVRRWSSIALDHAVFAFGLASGPEAFLLIVWAPVFATIGYGLRFGRKWVVASQLTGSVIIGSALAVTPYWHEHLSLAVGIIASLLILPQYAVRLSHSLATERADALARTQALEQEARRDPLTGALNRVGVETVLAERLARGEAGVLLYMDLDGFKAVNDVAGHATGDQVLRDVVSAMRQVLRASDELGRLGGDEFALVVPFASLEDAQHIGEKLLQAVRFVTVDHPTPLPLGVSIGACAFPDAAWPTAQALLDEADARMYQAKRAGKHRVWSVPLPSPSK